MKTLREIADICGVGYQSLNQHLYKSGISCDAFAPGRGHKKLYSEETVERIKSYLERKPIRPYPGRPKKEVTA